MLSTENHSPADQHEISLKGVVDLSNPSLDDHKSCSKFSIRDYVSSTRSQDIKTNWPFSEKNLQLCLEYGVKDILPPFQCLHCVTYRRDGVESSSSEEGKIINSDMETPTEVGSIILSVESSSSGKEKIINPVMKTAIKVRNIDISRSESCGKQLPVATNGSPQEVFPKTSGKSKSHLAKRTENSKPSSTKKCKLVVKVGPSKFESGSNLNIASSMVEPMASSKVCPVCKTFLSSSNTTLNAHIDQCLSMDSHIEPSSKSRVIKHRIKPRKTRLMVDIYATAQHCTLEELERRNGRIWNERPSLSTIQEDTLNCNEEKKQSNGSDEEKKQSICSDEKGDEGAVYVDASGTKLRILNKIGDSSPVKKMGLEPRQLDEPFRKDKGSKLLKSSKKKQKHKKFLKIASPTEKTRSYKTRLASRILEDHENKDESTKKDENMGMDVAQSSESQNQMGISGTMLPNWASSKGSDILKRRFESEKPSFHDSYLERSYCQKNLNCDEISYVSHQKGKGKDNSSCESPVNQYHEQPPLKKQMGFKPVRSLSFTSVDRTFSSSREQMLSVDHASKFGKSKSFRTSDCHGYNQKNIEHRHRIDEEPGQVPSKRSNVFKIKKKKSPSVIFHGAESRQDHGNRESPPPRVGENFEDRTVNAELEPPRGGEIRVEQSLMDDFGNVMNLTKSFNQDLYSIGNTDMETEMEHTDEERNYFSGIDPITIPGPPGSFLPSPGRMSPDEDRQGSSSLTTSQVRSSVDHLEMVDRDWSYSPKSANSNVSNSLLARPHLNSTENLSLEAHVPNDEFIKFGLSDEITKINLVSQDGQPCGSPKENIYGNNQESLLLKRRVMSSSPVPTVDNESSYYLNRTVFPVAVSGVGPVSVKVPVKPPLCGDFGSPSPSSPNHVLRLMGKNLLVVNNDEDLNHSPNSNFHVGHLDRNAVHQGTPIYGYKGTEMDLHEQNPTFRGLKRSLSMPFSPLGYNKTERVETLTGKRNEESSVHKHRKDVIIIDDIPENEVHTNGMNVNQTSYGGFPIPLSGYYNSRHINPFHCYQGPGFSPFGGPCIIPNTSSPMPPPCLGPMRWNNRVVESSTMQSSGSLPSSPATKHARSSLYYSPSMS